MAKAPPMIQDSGMGPQKRLSSDSPRLSPIMNQWPGGIVIGVSEGAAGALVVAARVADERLLLELAVADHAALADRDPVPGTGHDRA